MKLKIEALLEKRLGKYYRFIVYLALIVLINIVGQSLSLRVDLTRSGEFTLSDASVRVVKTLSEPLTIKVFFTKNLPAPYNGTERYLRDLLKEYAYHANQHFNYAIYDYNPQDESKKNAAAEDAPESYGISPYQLQYLDNDEVKFKQAYLGMAIIHGNLVERIPFIKSTEGLEYQVTSTIQRMNNKISALLNVPDQIGVKLFFSSPIIGLGPYMGINGFDDLVKSMQGVIEKANRKNYGKLKFESLDPSARPEYEEQAKKYEILKLSWPELSDKMDPGKKIPAGSGYIGMVVEHGGRVESIKLLDVVQIPFFGTRYQLARIETMEDAISEAVENLLNINQEIGYLTDHGTLPLGGDSEYGQQQQQEEGITHFQGMVGETYTLKPVNLQDGIPENVQCLVIAGPKQRFSDYDLYRIDQYLMKGRSVAVFLDSFSQLQIPPQYAQYFQNQGPQYVPVETGLEKLLSHYGVSVRPSYVLDESCFVQQNQQMGNISFYNAPLIKSENINGSLKFLKNIRGMVMLNLSPLEVAETNLGTGVKAVRLFSSSPQSWEMSGQIDLNPMTMRPPDRMQERPCDLAYVLEGNFKSYFAGKPVPVMESATNQKPKGASGTNIRSEGATITEGKPGKLLVIATSEILKNNVLDEGGKTPNSQFIMNTLDYLNGRSEYADMRTKSQNYNPIKDPPAGMRNFIKAFNIAGLPVLAAAAGLLVWFRRGARRRKIEGMFAKNANGGKQK